MCDLPSWIQAICAIGTLLLALIIMWQSDKIKTLTDVVGSLDEQNKISQTLLNFEIRSRLNEVQPNFITSNLTPYHTGYVVSFKNVGLRGRNVKAINPKNLTDLHRNDKSNLAIERNEIIEIVYRIQNNSIPFSFELQFEDNHGTIYIQKVYTRQGNNTQIKITISEPIKE